MSALKLANSTSIGKNDKQINSSIINNILEIILQHQQKIYTQVLTSFEYFGEGPKIYEDLIHSKEYNCFTKEMNLFQNTIDDLSKEITKYHSVQILDLGVGDGEKWKNSFETLGSHLTAHYTGVDISANMIEIAQKHFYGKNIKY